MNITISELKKLARKQRKLSNVLRKELSQMPHKIKGNFIAFFGRQFNPKYKWNCALKPLWSGFYIKYNDLEMMVDPGVNILERAQKIGVNLALTNTLYISHGHIDHGHDANVVAEMVAYGENSSLQILMSEHTKKEKIMSHYHSSTKDKAEILLIDQREKIDLGYGVKLKPIKVSHKINGSYGFVLDLNGFKIGYTGDTGFISTFKTIDGKELPISDKFVNKDEIDSPGTFNKRLKKVFSEVDLLVFNLHDVEFRKQSKHSLYHSTVSDAVNVLSGSKVKCCYFEHFNPHGCLGPEYPKKVNEYIKYSTEKETKLVGLNGLIVNLNNA